MDVGLEETLELRGMPVWMALRLSTRSQREPGYEKNEMRASRAVRFEVEPGYETGDTRQEPRRQCVPKGSLGTR